MNLKIPKLQPHIEQAVRVRLATARQKLQTLTLGIYPESLKSTVETVATDTEKTKENAARLNESESMAVSVSPDLSTPSPEAFKNETQKDEDWDYQP